MPNNHLFPLLSSEGEFSHGKMIDLVQPNSKDAPCGVKFLLTGEKTNSSSVLL